MAQAGATAGLVNQAWLVAQARMSGSPEPQRIPVQVESPGHKRATNYASFVLPGLLGLNLVSMGLFSVGMVNVSYREKGKFRRLAVVPLQHQPRPQQQRQREPLLAQHRLQRVARRRRQAPRPLRRRPAA